MRKSMRLKSVQRLESREMSATQFSLDALEPRTFLSAALVKDILPDSSETDSSSTSTVVKAGASTYFSTYLYPGAGYLWKTDGSPRGTRLVADFSDYPTSTIGNFAELNGLTYFLYDNALWQTNDQPGGTAVVQADSSARYFIYPRNLVSFKGALYFTDGSSATPGRLWRSDGTPGGLQRMLPIKAGDENKSAIGRPVSIGDALVFQVVHASKGTEIWRTDGTVAGTYALLSGTSAGSGRDTSAAGSPFYRMGTSLYVLHHDAEGKATLWRTDGTRAGTEQVTSNGALGTSRFSDGVVDGNVLYFGTYSGGQASLWKTDGTDGGTNRIKTFNEEAPPSYGLLAASFLSSLVVSGTFTDTSYVRPSPLTNFHLAGGTAVFTAEVDGVRQLFRTDGTEIGTRQITDYSSYDYNTPPIRDFTVVGETLYFTVAESEYDNSRLYATDGTVGGTRQLWTNGDDPNHTEEYHNYRRPIQNLSAVDGLLYFTGYVPGTGKDVLRWNATGSVSGVLFNDSDLDGVRQDNELALRGWKVFLDKNRNGTRDPGELFARTNSAGRYRFHSFPPGTYTIGVVPPDAPWNSTMPAAQWNASVPVVSGRTSKLNLSVAENDPSPGSVAGSVLSDQSSSGIPADVPTRGVKDLRVFVDLDNDGAWDATREPSDVTGANGSYRIDGLLPGRYRVTANLSGSPYTSLSGVGQLSIVNSNSVAKSEFKLHYDSADSTINGRIYNDVNRDGSLGIGEAGFAGLKLYLDLNRDKKLSSGEPVATTDAQGRFNFRGLTFGSYRVRQIGFPAGNWLNTGSTISTASVNISDSRSVSFGFAASVPAGVSGYVFDDQNENGRRDTGEPTTMAGASVSLTASDGTVRGETIHSGGRYHFQNVFAGDYQLKVHDMLSSAWVPTTAVERSIKLRSSEPGLADFGFTNDPIASIRGSAFHDLNRNRARDASEPAFAGTEFYLDLDRDLQLDANEPRDVSDADGHYEFKGLSARHYIIRATLPLEWTGGAGVTLDQGEQARADLAMTRYYGIRGYVFLDGDRDNHRDHGEGLQDGVILYFDENQNGILDVGETSRRSFPLGPYSFPNISGTHRIGVIAPHGYTVPFSSFTVTLDENGFFQKDIPVAPFINTSMSGGRGNDSLLGATSNDIYFAEDDDLEDYFYGNAGNGILPT